MSAKKPNSVEEYCQWLKTAHNVEITLQTANHYKAAAAAMQSQFERSPFWQELASNNALQVFEGDYRLQHQDYPLLLNPVAPALLSKSYESFLQKTYRINVIHNRNWPNPPRWQRSEGWVLPDNWFGRVNDIVRTCFTVKYFDGVHFLADKLRGLAEKHKLRLDLSLQARDEGYYAAHLYAIFDAAILTRDWGTQTAQVSAELQITTQLQDVIRRMLHKHYETRRMEQPGKEWEWKWDHRSQEFATNYLGHILHYLEGMIVEIRDRPKEVQ